jgi:hypothetical protein
VYADGIGRKVGTVRAILDYERMQEDGNGGRASWPKPRIPAQSGTARVVDRGASGARGVLALDVEERAREATARGVARHGLRAPGARSGLRARRARPAADLAA